MKSRGRLWFSSAWAVVCVGCAVGPNYHRPDTPSPATWSTLPAGPATTQPGAPTTQPVDITTWWKSLNDPTLDDLIDEAIAANLDLAVATARVREARAQRDVVAGVFWPQVSVDGGYTYRGSSVNTGPSVKNPKRRFGGLPLIAIQPGAPGAPPTIAVIPSSLGPFHAGGRHAPSVSVQPPGYSSASGLGQPSATISPPAGAAARVSRELNLFQLGFDATWELDIFGGIRRSVESADDTLAGAVESRRDVLVTLLSEVALDYVQLRGSQRRLAIANENIAAQQDTVELTRTRYQAGFTNELDVSQAQAQLATTQSQVPLLETAIQQAIYQLSVLLGQTPDALVDLLEESAPIPAVPPAVPLGLPSDLLRRRPDIRVAAYALASATAQIGVATADLFPKFSLTGSFGSQTSDMRHFLDSRSLFFSVGPAVSWPIFQGGSIVANIEVQNARQAEALATYQKAVLTAFQDVDSSLVAYLNEMVRHGSLTEAVAANQQAADLSNELYSRGLTAFLNVLVSQQALYNSQDQLVQSETTVVTNLISLYKALGGGWEVSPN